jgi:hypothetical protein
MRKNRSQTSGLLFILVLQVAQGIDAFTTFTPWLEPSISTPNSQGTRDVFINNRQQLDTHQHGHTFLIRSMSRNRGGEAAKPSSNIRTTMNKFTLINLRSSLRQQYRRRVAADENFLSKSFLEVALAAGTQITAEVTKRGFSNMMRDIDFVMAGVLTAIAGKYYSMWRVAPTANVDENSVRGDALQNKIEESTKYNKTEKVPTNAFQPTLLDGTKPTIYQRLLAFIVPIPSLFQAGIIASLLGYGLTAILITSRSLFFPSYVPLTANVNIIHACLYTGALMAIVSTIRYQLLQGLIEPMIIDQIFSKHLSWLKMEVIFLVRLANGLLGSSLAITGMRLLGLQKLK